MQKIFTIILKKNLKCKKLFVYLTNIKFKTNEQKQFIKIHSKVFTRWTY